MGREIERKFVLKGMPHLFNHISLMGVKIIEQTYLATGEEEIRIRKASGISTRSNNDQYTLTIKKGSGLEREETETAILESTYERVLSTINAVPIIKQRGYIRLRGLKIEIDTYLNPELKGLIVAEIEFDTMQDAVDAELPDWLDTEVTHDASFKNQALWEKLQSMETTK